MEIEASIMAESRGMMVGGRRMLLTDTENFAAENTISKAATLGTTTYQPSLVSTGNRFLDAIGMRSGQVSNLKVWLDPSLTGADLIKGVSKNDLTSCAVVSSGILFLPF